MQVGPINDFALGIYDGPHATPQEADEGPVFLGIKNVTPQGTLDLSEIRHVSEQEYPRWTKRVVPQSDDIVFSYEATLHRYAIIPENFRGCLGRRMALIRPDKSKVVPRFLHYYFLSPTWRAQIESNIISGATVDRVPLTRFPGFEVKLPNLALQERIASILSAYDDLIENNRRRIQLLEQAARLLYKEWFVHLRFPGHEHVTVTDGVPEGWLHAELADLCLGNSGIQTGPFGSQLHQSDYTDRGVPVVMPQDLKNLRISTERIARVPEALAEKLARHRLAPSDIVYGRRGDIGRRALVSDKEEGYLCGTGCLRLRPNQERVNPHFLYHALGDYRTQTLIRNRAKGSTMPNLSAKLMASLPVLVPSRLLQQQFGAFATDNSREIELLTDAIAAARVARDLLLPRLMNGEIAV
nr:restriction endonuclease subunit S [Halochromatium salexigens]